MATDREKFKFLMDEYDKLKDPKARSATSDIWDEFDESNFEEFKDKLVGKIDSSSIFILMLESQETIDLSKPNNVQTECLIAKKLDKPFVIFKLKQINLPDEFLSRFVNDVPKPVIVDVETVEEMVSYPDGLMYQLDQFAQDCKFNTEICGVEDFVEKLREKFTGNIQEIV